MRPRTLLQLNELNKAFYAAIAHEWSRHRATPWPGFARVVEHARRTQPAFSNPIESQTRPWSVLDVGAGDGRFAAYLAELQVRPLAYLGVDADPTLLGLARARGLSGCELVQHDFVAESPATWLGARRFELIALLGALHHVPSETLRSALLAALAKHLTPDGLLAVTFWRLTHDERFERRLLSWASYNENAQDPIDEADLEPGDTLLRWGQGAAPPRYCHFVDDAELARLIAGTGLCVRERFLADGRGGRLNEYVLLSPTAA